MEIFSLAFFALIAVLTHFYAYTHGYFTWPYGKEKSAISISGKQLTAVFGFYFLSTILLGPIIAKSTLHWLNARDPQVTSLSIMAISTLQFALMFLIFLVLALLGGRQFPLIFKEKRQKSASYDFGLGVATWCLGFPLVTVISDLADWFVNHFFGIQYYEQAAVGFLKKAMASPSSLLFAILSVMVLAPLIEELLFRGFLQNYLKSKLGPKAAILLSAFTFACFHFSASQGLGNISLALSLFILGIYLGFLYERQRSLFASLGLHISFNLVSAIRILISPETT